MRKGSIWHKKKPIKFIADHPFIFTIVRKPDDSVLFMGRYVGV